MCGIFGYIGQKDNASNIVLEGLKALEYRGYDSWGVAAVPSFQSRIQSHPSLIVVKKKIGKIGNATVDDLPPSHFALGHTRWATHGGVTDTNAHPHLDCTHTIALVHNGIVENYQQLKSHLLSKGHTFISETDTEVIVHLIEELSKKHHFPEATRLAFKKLTGLNAIIVLNTTAHQFVACRNGSPLILGFGKGEHFLASDTAALLPYTKQVYFLEDQEMITVQRDQIDLYDVESGTSKSLKPTTITWKPDQAEKGTFPYYLIKEIHEQPTIIATISHSKKTLFQPLATIIAQADRIYLIGCGTASYACLAGSYLFSKVAKKSIQPIIASEFLYEVDFLTPNSLIIVLSQSGETMDTLEAVKMAKQTGAKILALVNGLGSSLYRVADFKILLEAGPEKSVASTKAFISKLCHLLLLAYALKGDFKLGQRILNRAHQSATQVLKAKHVSTIQKLAKRISKANHLYVIGRGLSYPASLESALKIKETSYIHAEGFAGGELKHGVLALVEKGTPCLAFLPNDETYSATLAGAMEMKARGGYIIGVSYKPDDMFDYYLPVADAQEATIIPNVITAQLLAYYLSLELGLDPDMPRNLAKSVTVK